MQWDKLYLDKTDGTFADTLTALGLMVFVNEIQQRNGVSASETKVRVIDEGNHYRLDISPTIKEDWLKNCGFFMPAPLIGTQKSMAKLPPDVPAELIIDYEQERDKRAAYFEMRKQYTQEAKKAEKRLEDHPLLATLEELKPHKHWEVFRLINPGALAGYNNLMSQWWEIGHSSIFADALLLLFDLFANTPNDVISARASWNILSKQAGLSTKTDASSLQVYNPSKGKGLNRPKADATIRMDNVSDFWLIELLKATGFYEGALTKVLRGPGQPSRSNDRKTYVISPTDVGYSDVRTIMDSFRDKMVWSETSRKLDVLAGLRFTIAMLERSIKPEGVELLRKLMSGNPRSVIGGFQVAFYKDLGQSAATMNISYLNLPGWIVIRNTKSASEYLGALEEHEAIIRQFQEDRGEDIQLLGVYRDFMSGDELDTFFEFTAGYSGWLMSQRERSNRGRQLTTDNLGRLLMNTDPNLKEIIESEGFQRIAYAIRQATVTAQYRKKQGDRRYDVYYGLGQKLARKSFKTEDFVPELMDFARAFNAENAQVMENRPGPYRRSIRTTDLDEVIELLGKYGSHLVGNMLIAYGYAREPFERDTAEGDTVDEEQDMKGMDE